MAKVKVLNGNTHPITLIMRGKPEDEVTKVHIPSAEKSSDGKKLIAGHAIVDGDFLTAARKINKGVDSYFKSFDGADSKLKIENVPQDSKLKIENAPQSTYNSLRR
jgi:hypothetical protein